MTRDDLKIVFLGTPDFAVESLDRLVKDDCNIAAVVTMPDKIAGRGHKLLMSPVKKYAIEHNLQVLQPANLKDPAFIEELRGINADLFIVIAFRMLPQTVWQMPRFGTFNLHASLLPRYRGAAPINRAVMNGDKETGVTTFFLKHEIDTGDIIARQAIEIGEDEDAGSVHDRLMTLGAEMVSKTVDDIIAGNGHIESMPQPEGEFIPAPKIFTETCAIDWTLPAEKVRNHVRGLSPYPAAHTLIAKEDGSVYTLKVFSGRRADDLMKPGLTPGDIIATPKRLAVMCADAPYEITSLQLQGKKRMDTSAFLLGFKPAPKIPNANTHEI
ncbi:MAG: methionyl-tRNA formyltransferase [Prevotella sp.]|nr:methionyl-tRNA formyltransferase [Prevotella sp.]MCM1074281.1 methionyl-tRNA formyltransferase [Ruminococcus sp.]